MKSCCCVSVVVSFHVLSVIAVCPTVQAGTSRSCLGANAPPSCAALGGGQLDGVVLVDPSQGRAEARLAGTTWIAPSWDENLLAVTPSDTGYALKSSMAHIGAVSDTVSIKRAEQTRIPGLTSFALPKVAPRRDPNLDVWVAVDQQGGAGEPVRQTGSRFGADYSLRGLAVMGLAVERSDKELTLGAATGQESLNLATYIALRPIPTVTLNARAGWGEHHAVAGLDTLDTSLHYLTAQLRSDWQLVSLKLTPQVSITRGDETDTTPRAQAAGAAGAQRELTRVTVGPRVSRPIDLGGGRSLDPFISYETKLDLSPRDELKEGAAATARTETKIGAGVTLTKPDAYTLRATTDLEEAGTPQSNVKGRLELKVPIR